MICPHCQTANSEAAKFCENCGKPLERLCPNCGQPVSSTAKFCNNCGFTLAPTPVPTIPAARHQQTMPRDLQSKLESARASHTMQGERRIVTVLFCDVKGSTAMAERLDPEEWTEIMNVAFESLIAPVYRYEGTVARLMGDAILAFFGAPIAHEDDPQRAVLAGLGIVESIQDFRERMKRERGLDFNVRVGINTGLVVVGEVGSDLRVEYTAMGDAVNLAARMEQTAEPGTVQIAGNTYKLIAPLFEVASLGGIEVKGKSEPAPAYRVIAPKAAPGRLRGIEGLDSPLVGREREIGLLQSALADAQVGRGHIVALMGEAGLGKSRLVAELRNSVTQDGRRETAETSILRPPSSVRWHEGRSLSYETSTPYAPFVDLFHSVLDLRRADSDAHKYFAIKAKVNEVAPGRAATIAPFIAAMLDISFGGDDFERVKYLTPPDLRGRIFSAVADFVARLAAAQPVVLVFEDLHWADPTSLDLIEQLMPLTEQTSLLLLALFRPQRQEPSWRFHEVAARDYAHRYTAIQLEPLDEPHARELVANLLHIEDLPEKVRALILQKAEGNPFFVEEVVRSLLDAKLVVRDNGHWRATREIEHIAVPDTLAGVITARLDRLDEHAKRAAQTASVIGRDFPYDMLGNVYDPRDKLDGALSDLQRRELVREKSRLPQRAYLFKHALTQETAYASLLLSRRRELHRRVAECLERVAPERVNDIARHFLDAQERTRALPYVLTAADRAAKAYATREAIGYYTQALQILETVTDTQAARRAYEGLGGALTLANDAARAVETYQQMLALGQARDDAPMQISAFNKLGYVVGMWMGQFSEAEKYLTDAEQLARAHQDKPGLAELFTFRCMMCTAVADFTGVEQHMGEMVSLGRELNIKEQMVMGLDHIANSMVWMTRFDEAWQAAQEALQLTREIGNREHEAAVLTGAVTFCHLRNGDFDAARAMATQGAQIAAKIGALFPHVFGEWLLGEIARARGEYESAVQHLQRASDLARPIEMFLPFVAVMPMATLGATYFDVSAQFTGQVADLHARAIKMFEHPAAIIGAASVWADLGFDLLAVGQVDEASEMFQKGLSAATIMMHVMKPRFLTGLALAAVAQGRLDDARKLADEASAFVAERKMRNRYPLVALADAQVSAARGEWERALESYARAESEAVAMQMRPDVWQARVGAAQLLAAQGRAVEAEAQSQGARAMADEIAGLFTDGELRAQFAEKVRRAVGSQQRTVNGER